MHHGLLWRPSHTLHRSSDLLIVSEITRGPFNEMGWWRMTQQCRDLGLRASMEGRPGLGRPSPVHLTAFLNSVSATFLVTPRWARWAAACLRAPHAASQLCAERRQTDWKLSDPIVLHEAGAVYSITSVLPEKEWRGSSFWPALRAPCFPSHCFSPSWACSNWLLDGL